VTSDFTIDSTVVIALAGSVLAALGVLASRWGNKRLTVGDGRGEAWRNSYVSAQSNGYGIALFGIMLTTAALFARCVM